MAQKVHAGFLKEQEEHNQKSVMRKVVTRKQKEEDVFQKKQKDEHSHVTERVRDKMMINQWQTELEKDKMKQ